MTRVEQVAAVVSAAHATFADADSLAVATRQEVTDLLALTAALSRIVDAQRVRLAGEIAERSSGPDEESICRVLGSRNPRDAVASSFGIRSREAAELLSLAAATSAAVSYTGERIAIAYPRVAMALDAGELSIQQARAIVGTLEPAAPRADLAQLAWAEGCLVDAATDADAPLMPELLVTQARAYVAVLDPDGVLPTAERQRALRSLRMWQRPDGIWRLEMSCPPEAGSALKAVLDAYTSPRVQVAFRDDACSATVDDGVAGGCPADDGGTDGRPIDDRTPAQQRHDVLIALVEAHAASGGAPVAGGEVPRLVFTGTIEAFSAYEAGLDHADRTLTIEHTGSIVPIETVDRLLCNAVVQRAVVDAAGHVLELGRTERFFSRAQRRALAAQYGGCATPGCRMPVPWTEAHHVTWWRHGGLTDVENGILLCSHCHHEVHAGRLRVIGTPGHWRVIAQLRPATRYGRSRRAARTSTAAACAAATPLAALLADEAPSPTSSSGLTRMSPKRTPRRARRTTGPIESAMRQRLLAGRRSGPRLRVYDVQPLALIVLRR